MFLAKIFSQRVTKMLIFLTFIGLLLHFYNLNWGAPYYFHPDERNIAGSVAQLSFPTQMNPHFFAYGSLPLYTIYFSGLFFSYFHHVTDPFSFALQISRFYSAFFATLLIPLMFFIGKKIKNEQTGIIAALFGVMSVGIIQFAHFGTFEIWLTFFSLLLFLLCLGKPTNKNLVGIGIVTGILLATKISSLVLLPIPILSIIINDELNDYKKQFKKKFIKKVFQILLFLSLVFSIYFLSNPFVLLDKQSFLDSMNYESSLAIGTLPVFYTGEFFNTIPVIFQIKNIFPFLINPFMTLLFLISFFFLTVIFIKTKTRSSFFLILFFLILFLTQAFLFAKWTRYMMPTVPFIYLMIAFAVSSLFDHLQTKKTIISFLIGSLIFINTIFAFSYFVTAFIREDSRINAYQFALRKIPYESKILSEIYDMGIVPFNSSYHNITLFHFYDLDNNSLEATPESLKDKLDDNDFIILPSQRLLKTRLLQKEKFPFGYSFYKSLQTETTGYSKIYETPCDIFCQITYLGDPVFRFEQTANVFDRPTVMIFQKNKN